jgi:hypothetical protein
MFQGGYWLATKHPWACALFVTPLLLIYELGPLFLGPGADQFRNGADVWLRSLLASWGVPPAYGLPILLATVLLLWTLLHRDQRPDDYLGAWTGMMAESAVFALVLYGLSQGVWPFVQSLGKFFDGPKVAILARLEWAETSPYAVDPTIGQVISYLGAGIYEEALFRLLGFAGLLWVLQKMDMPGWTPALIAGLGSALIFAGAHNLGPHGEPFHAHIFLFRTLAGLYFAWIYRLRGFGIAVGAHAGYDVLVGILVRRM